MANEIQLTIGSGKTLTYIAYAPDGTARTPSVSTNLPEIGSTGYYTQTDANVVVGDEVVVKEGSAVVGGGQYEIAQEAMRGTNGVTVSDTDNITLAVNTTSYSLYFKLIDSTSGLPKTGLVYSDITISTIPSKGDSVGSSPVLLASPSAVYLSEGFTAIALGIYRYDVPDSEIDTDSETVTLVFRATGVQDKTVIINVDENITFIKNMQEADTETDTTTTPWHEVKKIKGTSTELSRKAMTTAAAADITSDASIIGNLEEPGD